MWSESLLLCRCYTTRVTVENPGHIHIDSEVHLPIRRATNLSTDAADIHPTILRLTLLFPKQENKIAKSTLVCILYVQCYSYCFYLILKSLINVICKGSSISSSHLCWPVTSPGIRQYISSSTCSATFLTTIFFNNFRKHFLLLRLGPQSEWIWINK